MNIAKIIREARENLNLNQSQLAELVGVSPQAVQQWESGATQPRGKRLNKIAAVLKLPPVLAHFGLSAEADEATEARKPAEPPKAGRRSPAAGAAGVEASTNGNDPLIKQVIEAMRRMSKEDAARLVTISKALIGEGADRTPEVELKPLPVPDLPPHPAPAFPPRRMSEGRTKARGKTAVR